MAVSLVFALASPFFIGVNGILAIGTAVFGGVYGALYNARTIQRSLAGESAARQPDGVVFLISLLLGFFGTIAGCIAFVVTCVPVSLVVGNSSFGPTQGYPFGMTPAVFLIWVGSVVVALLVVGIFLRLFLPRKPRP